MIMYPKPYSIYLRGTIAGELRSNNRFLRRSGYCLRVTEPWQRNEFTELVAMLTHVHGYCEGLK